MPDRLSRLIGFCGFNPKTACQAAGLYRAFVSQVINGDNKNPSLASMSRLMAALQIPLNALETAGPSSQAWFPVSNADPLNLTTILRRMTRADCILSVSDDMDSYLLPDELSLNGHMERWRRWGLTGSRLDDRIRSLQVVSHLRRDARLSPECHYRHHVIGPESVALRALAQKSEWVKRIKDSVTQFWKKTAVDFIPDRAWPDFTGHIGKALWVNDWHKINVADDLVACVWTTGQIWATYAPGEIQRLLDKVEEAVNLYGRGAFFPNRKEHGIERFVDTFRATERFLEKVLRV